MEKNLKIDQKPLHILIVDDFLEDRDLIRRSLLNGSERRYRFTEAENVEDALEMWLQFGKGVLPDLLLVDMNMPGMDGIDLLEELRGNDEIAPLPIVMLTGSGQLEKSSTALAAGAQDFIEKSHITPENLNRTIINALDRYQLVSQHLSQRKKIEDRLRFQASILEQIKDAVIAVDNNNQIIYFNPVAAQQYGVSQADAIGYKIDEIYRYEWLKPSDEHVFHRSLEQTGLWQGPGIHLKRNGEKVYVESSVSTLKDEYGCQSGLLIVIRDVTQQRKTRVAYRENETRLWLALNAGRMGTWEWNLETNDVRLNTKAHELWGIDKNKRLLKVDDILATVHPDDLSAVEAALNVSIKDNVDYEAEFRICLADETIRWLAGRGGVLQNDAGQRRMVGVNFDVTKRKQTEIDLRQALQRQSELLTLLESLLINAPIGFAFFDREHRYVKVNQVLAEINGLPVKNHIDQPIRKLLPVNAIMVDSIIDQVFETGQAVKGFEVSGETPVQPGVERHWLTSFYPILSENKIRYVGATVIEITDRKQAEAALQNLNQILEDRVARRTAELERSLNELDQFAYVASHDLKAPLRAIGHLASWIAEDAKHLLPDTSKIHLQKMQGRIARMEQLLDDLLAYSRAGRYYKEVEAVNTQILVRELINLHSLPSNFTVVIQADMPTLVTYRIPLELVLRNLISNALKHHDRDDGLLSVSARELDDMIEFTVEDDGPGIDPAYHQRIFEMFQTLKPQDEVEGSGMGLAIVKKTVESQGGTIKVNSSQGRGAKFQFIWPQNIIASES